MKRFRLSVAVISFGLYLHAQGYMIADNGSEVKFSIKNFGFNVTGKFKGLKGKATFNPANLPGCSINASVDAGTIDTDNGSRDSHLKKEDYFDVAKHPLISFVSDKIAVADNNTSFVATGKITIKGITRPISFPFTAALKNEGYFFQGEFKLDRRDFGVGGKSLVMSNSVTVSLAVLATKVN